MATYIRVKKLHAFRVLFVFHIFSTPPPLSLSRSLSLSFFLFNILSLRLCPRIVHILRMMTFFIFNAFRINTFVSICWRCHYYYYCHALTCYIVHETSAIFIKCIFKLCKFTVSTDFSFSFFAVTIMPLVCFILSFHSSTTVWIFLLRLHSVLVVLIYFVLSVHILSEL